MFDGVVVALSSLGVFSQKLHLTHLEAVGNWILYQWSSWCHNPAGMCTSGNGRRAELESALSGPSCRRNQYAGMAACYWSFRTVCGAALFTSSCALIFCSPAVRVSICFCCCAIIARCSRTCCCSSTNALCSFRNSLSNITFICS